MNTLLRGTFLGVSATLGFLAPVQAHHAPSGWKYPGGCCNAADCFQIDSADVERAATGWLIKNTQV
jgi:hypothetical protein